MENKMEAAIKTVKNCFSTLAMRRRNQVRGWYGTGQELWEAVLLLICFSCLGKICIHFSLGKCVNL